MSKNAWKLSAAIASVLSIIGFARPAFAVWPMPQYSEYPCTTAVTPAENCSSQGGDPNIHRQTKLSDRTVLYPSQFSCTPNSGQFGGFCDGPGCFSPSGYCRQPSILGTPTYEIVQRPEGAKIRFHLEYDFPGNYCQLSPSGNVAEWPIVFNNYHLDRLQVLDSSGNNVLAESMAVFEHGQWNPLLPFCGNSTYLLRVFNGCGPTFQTVTVNVDLSLLPDDSLTPCAHTRECPSCKNKSNTAGHPINVGSGDVGVAVPLFSVAQSPLPLAMTLSYHSQLAGNQRLINEPMGHGWTHTFNESLRVIDRWDGDLYRLRDDGDETWYRRVTPTQWVSQRPGDIRETVTLINGQYQVKDLDGDATAFDGAGNWISYTDRWGNTVSGIYSGGLLSTITDAAGRQLQLTYSGALLTGITLPDGGVWRFVYNGGELSQIFDPIHTGTTPWRTIEYQADTRGTKRLLTAMRDESGALLEGHAYDALERGISSFAGANSDLVTLQYNGALPSETIVTSTIDGTTSQTAKFSVIYQRGRFLPLEISGNCMSCGEGVGGDDDEKFTYDESNFVTSRTDGNGVVMRYTYDSNGLVTSIVDAVGTPVEHTTSYVRGYAAWPSFVTQTTEASAARPNAVRTTTTSWNATGTPETTLTTADTGWLTAADAAPVTYTTVKNYDARHRLLTEDGPRSDVADVTTNAYFPDNDADVMRRGRLQSVTDPAGVTWNYDNYSFYGLARLLTDPNGVQSVRQTDARGRLVSTTIKAVPGDPRETADYTSTWTFDGRDRTVKWTLPRGNASTYVYEDGTNRMTDTVRLDAAGNERERRHFTLNAIGDHVRQENQHCDTPAAPCPNWTTQRREDYVFDSHNRVLQIRRSVPAGSTVNYGYDAAGLLRTVQDENHTQPNVLYSYDPLRRRTLAQQTLGASMISTSYRYDVQDNLVGVTDPNGNSTSWTFDDFHRVQTQTSPVTGTTSYTYDPAGDVITATDGSGATTTRTWDAAGRILTATSSRSGNPNEVLTYTYDGATPGNYGKGRLATTADSTGMMAYAYERRGMVRQESHTIQGNAYSIAYAYDAGGNLTSITYPSGRVVTYGFDYAERPLSATSGATTFVSSANYLPFGPESQLVFGNGTTKTTAYDLRYRPIENKLTGGDGTIADYHYDEDPLGNVTAIRDLVDPAYDRTFGYDDLNRLTSANTGGALWGSGSYRYDAMGNMTSLAVGSTRQSNFTYNGTRPMLSAVTENGSTRAVAYDAAGNEQTIGAATYGYSPRNLLTSGDGLSYTYDARGLRTITTVTAALGTFSGTVVTVATAAPVAGATVTVDGTLNSTTTDANGNFSLNQPAGNFTLTVVKNGFLPETTTAFTLTAGASVAVGTVRLSVAPSTVAGTITSSLGGSVAGATITLSGTSATTSSDPRGNFAITLAAGTFTATISAGGYISQTTASFTTQPGQTYSIGTITLAAIPATVTGTVTSSTGGAVAGATVTASSGPTGASHNGRIVALANGTSTTTDGSGNFTLSLAAGTYTLTISKAGFGSATTSDFAVGAGTTFSLGTITIDPLGTITGQVVAQATGSPIANATVALPGSVSSVSTNATGHFSIQQPPGTYSVHASATGFADVTTLFFNLAPGATYDAGMIRLPAVALAVYVGYADDLRPSANFPVPWAGTPNVIYIGSTSPIDAGAIRLDNNTEAPMPVDGVKVDLGRPGPTYDLWGSFAVPAHGSVILTQTSQFNFDTSDSPIAGCGQPLVAGEPRVPRVVVKSNGVSVTYYDTGHILDTGGYDLACTGNESLQWRLIGTTGINANGDFLLGPPTGTSPLGQPYSVTASVTDGTGQPLANVAVAFRVIQGPNNGTSGSATTDATGTATFTYTSHAAGNDTIQALITNASGGVSKSNPVTINWPAFTNINIFVGYADDLRAGASFPNPWRGSPNVVYIGSGSPIDAGAIRIDNKTDSPITIDKVFVDLQRPGPTFDLWGSFTIPAHGSAILTQTTQYNFDTSDFQFLGCGGTLPPGDPRIPKITVTTGGQTASYLDTSHILDTFGYDLACITNESLQWRPVGSSSTADAGHLALRPLSSVTVVGGTYVATAIATDAGNEPVAGLPVDFQVVTGPNTGKSGRATTDANGLATFSYSSTTAGADTLRASITNSVGAVLTSNNVTSAWVTTVSVQLGPFASTATVGSPTNATALVVDVSSAPLASVFVTFRVVAGPNSGKTGQGITDSTGHAVFTYFSTVAGTDTIVASIVGANGGSILSNQVTATWVAPMAITLAPSSASNPIGANYTATAFVSSAGSPSSGASVSFNVVTGPNAGKTSATTTDGTGHATFTFTSQTIGTDVVQARTGSLSSNQVVAKWIAVPTLVTYTGAVAGEVNDPLALSARLTEALTGNPIAGRGLAFTFGAQTLTGTTDANGNAGVSVTSRTMPSAVAASVTFAAAGSYTGSSTSLFINVVRDESAIRYTGKTVLADGTAQTLTALLTDSDGIEPLAGRIVTFNVASMIATATTDANGVASATVNIPISAGTGSIRLAISFAGDSMNVPASTSVPVILYQPQSFVIWGGNTIQPHFGDRVNFWGSQWDRQVTGGDYAANASFKGYASDAASPLAACEATGHADGKCWSSKPGNSFPPATVERYISVMVSTSIVKNGGSIVGNIAAAVVVRVDPSPAYGNDPGKPGYGVIVAVIDDGAHLFPASTSRRISSMETELYFFRHVMHPRAPQVVSLVQPNLASLAVSRDLMAFDRSVTSVLRPAGFSVAAGNRRYSFYSPEMNLLAETALSSSGAPPIAYEYVWFNGHPVAQLDASGATHWTFTDHLGAPTILTNADGSVHWRAEYEPFGAVFALRSADVHQPLRLPGQEAEQLDLGANGVTEKEYNINRWYHSAWGRYSQSDPAIYAGREERARPNLNPYEYVEDNPQRFIDPSGLSKCLPHIAKFYKDMCNAAKAASGPDCPCKIILVQSGWESKYGKGDTVPDNNYIGLHGQGNGTPPSRQAKKAKKKTPIARFKTPQDSYNEYCRRVREGDISYTNDEQFLTDVTYELVFSEGTEEYYITELLRKLRLCADELEECCCGKGEKK